MSWLKLRIKGPAKSKVKGKHSAHQMYGIRYVLKHSQELHDDIIKYFQSNPPLTIEDFRSRFPYPLYYMPLNLSVSLYHKISLGKDGIVRLREAGDYNDSGIAITAAAGEKLTNRLLGK